MYVTKDFISPNRLPFIVDLFLILFGALYLVPLFLFAYFFEDFTKDVSIQRKTAYYILMTGEEER